MSHIELLPKWNVHHIWWERRDYTSKLDKAFRNATENKIAVPMRNHKHLHAMLLPPPKPSRQQMFDLLDILEDTTVDEQMNRLWALDKTAEYFGQLAVQDEVDFHRHDYMKNHFISQIGYLTMHEVTLSQ